ncbi:hypothetical protein [Bradyrhizobium cosmicum]|uniref:hypothetical protein n=1 Tax=Bradyrhizobium cosmicum TaxID=1404864 RepID=UPI0028ED9178|nr:hypothetical protein [Bradyrhizobium cosmicum]
MGAAVYTIRDETAARLMVHLPRQKHRAYRLVATWMVEALSALDQEPVDTSQPQRLDHPRKQNDAPVRHFLSQAPVSMIVPECSG